MENDLIQVLESYYLKSNVDIFEMHFSGQDVTGFSTIPISHLGEILYNTQEIITSLASDSPLAKRASISII